MDKAFFAMCRRLSSKLFVLSLWNHETAVDMIFNDHIGPLRHRADDWVTRQHHAAHIHEIANGKECYHVSWKVAPSRAAVPVWIWDGFDPDDYFPDKMRSVP